jgi:hypothetical protein
MATATLSKGFTHDGKVYHIGDQFEGSDYEIGLLTRQGFVAPKTDKSADEPGVDPGPGKGYNTSQSSAGSAQVHYPEDAVQPGQATQAQTAQPAAHHKK